MSNDSVNRQKQSGQNGKFGFLEKSAPTIQTLPQSALDNENAPMVLESCRNADGSHYSALLAGFTETQRATLERALRVAVENLDDDLEAILFDGDAEVAAEATAVHEETKALHGALFGSSPVVPDGASIGQQFRAAREAIDYHTLRDIAADVKTINPYAAKVLVSYSPDVDGYWADTLIDVDGNEIGSVIEDADPALYVDVQTSAAELERNGVWKRYAERTRHGWEIDLNRAARAGAPE